MKEPAPLPAATPAPAAAPAPAASPRQLGQILTADERTQLTRSLDQSLSAARAAVARVSGHPLPRDQADTLNLVNVLLEQAQAARTSDLPVAVQLAHRAELLARDLSASVR